MRMLPTPDLIFSGADESWARLAWHLVYSAWILVGAVGTGYLYIYGMWKLAAHIQREWEPNDVRSPLKKKAGVVVWFPLLIFVTTGGIQAFVNLVHPIQASALKEREQRQEELERTVRELRERERRDLKAGG